MDWLIVTDLDGTLLDDAYDYDDAAAALDSISADFAGVGIALASSKTLAEMLFLSQRATHPPMLIFENGAGYAMPRLNAGGDDSPYELTILGTSYAQICSVLYELGLDSDFRFRGFHQMSRSEVAERTGLGLAEAALARRRLASEPIRWDGDADALRRFSAALNERGLRLQRGGRFHHVTGDTDKRQALDGLLQKLAAEYDVAPRLIACGDAPNDLELIDVADRALLFPQRDGSWLRAADHRITHANAAGPADWVAGIRQILGEETTRT